MTTQILALINKLHFNSTKLHMFHWNVVGRDFLSFHKLFEESYLELLEFKDQMAEYLRFKEKGQAIVDFQKVAELAKGFKIPAKAEEMLKSGLESYVDILKDFKALDVAEKDLVLDAIISDILKALEKKIYFIQSILTNY